MAKSQHDPDDRGEPRVKSRAALLIQRWWITIALGFMALLPRLYVGWTMAAKPVWDGHYYHFGATRIAAGFGYSDELVIDGVSRWHPWCHYPVGYSGFLAGVYSLFGSGEAVAPMANAVIGALIVMLAHRIGVMWLGARRALVAGVLCAFSLELILYTPVVMTELLATLGPLLAIWLMLKFRSTKPLIGAVLAGVVVGLMTLVQPQLILFGPVLGALAIKAKLRSLRWVASALLTTVVAVGVVSPWTYRNCRVMDGCVFVSTNGGWNLAIGALPKATGRFVTLRSAEGCAVVLGQVHQDRCWRAIGLNAVRSDIVRWLELAPVKLGHTFDHASFPIGYLHETNPAAWPEAKRHRMRERLTLIHGLMMSVAAFGFVALWSTPTHGRSSPVERRTRDVRLRGRCRFSQAIQKIARWIWGRVNGLECLLAMGVATLVLMGWRPYNSEYWPLAVAIVITGLVHRPKSPPVGPAGVALVTSVLLVIVTHVLFFGEDRYHVRLIPVLCLFVAAVGRPSHGARDTSGSVATDRDCVGAEKLVTSR